MNDIAELQKIWMTKGNGAVNDAKQATPDTLMKKLKSLENTQSRINIIKVIVISSILIMMFILFPKSKVSSVFAYIGFAVIFISIVVFMTYYLRNQFNISKLNFTYGSLEFTNQTINLLQKQNAIFRKPFLIFFISMAVGLNFMLLGASVGLKTEEILLLFLIDNTSLVVFTFIGYRIRGWRIRREVTPLIDELTKAKESLSSER
jgi:hypothetical protein